MDILVVELATHASDLRFCVECLLPDHQLTVCTSSDTAKNAQLNEFKPTTLEEKDNAFAKAKLNLYHWGEERTFPYLEMSQWEALWKDHDHVIFITEITNVAFLKSLLQSGVSYSLFIHNAHSSLWRKPPLYASFMALGSLVKKKLLSGDISRNLHAKHARGLIFPTTLGAAYVSETGDTRVKFGFPWAIARPSNIQTIPVERLTTDHKPMLHIAIPGELDPRRRSFKIIEALIQAWDMERPLHVDFVGPAETQEACRFLESLKASAHGQLSITGDGEWLSSEEYTQKLIDADVLVLNHAVCTRYGFVEETGGLTKVSGVIHDAIRHGKRVYVNAGYHVSEELDGFVETYSDVDHLKQCLEIPIAPVEEAVWSSFSPAAQSKRWAIYFDNLS